MLGSSSFGGGGDDDDIIVGVGIDADSVDPSMVASTESSSSSSSSAPTSAGIDEAGLTTGHVFSSSSSAKKGSPPFFSIVDIIGRRNSSCRGKNTMARDFFGNKPEFVIPLLMPTGTGRRR